MSSAPRAHQAPLCFSIFIHGQQLPARKVVPGSFHQSLCGYGSVGPATKAEQYGRYDLRNLGLFGCSDIFNTSGSAVVTPTILRLLMYLSLYLAFGDQAKVLKIALQSQVEPGKHNLGSNIPKEGAMAQMLLQSAIPKWFCAAHGNPFLIPESV